jgi:hypothetical protein
VPHLALDERHIEFRGQQHDRDIGSPERAHPWYERDPWVSIGGLSLDS